MNRIMFTAVCAAALLTGCASAPTQTHPKVDYPLHVSRTKLPHRQPIVGLSSSNLHQYIGAGESGKTYPGPVLAASFQYGTSAWVVLGNTTTSPLVAYQSEDNGRTWRSAQIVIPGGDAASSLHIYAVSSKEAWILASGMPAANQEIWYLFHTVDAGAHWTLLQGRGASFLYGDVSSVVMKFSASGAGWIVADVPVITSGTTIGVDHTLNGGRTWTSSTLQFQPYWFAVQIVGPTNIGPEQWKLSVIDKGSRTNSPRVFRSTDNGATWH